MIAICLDIVIDLFGQRLPMIGVTHEFNLNHKLACLRMKIFNCKPVSYFVSGGFRNEIKYPRTKHQVQSILYGSFIGEFENGSRAATGVQVTNNIGERVQRRQNCLDRDADIVLGRS